MSAAAVASASGLLTDAVRYALGNVEVVTPDLLERPTPCRGWDLRMLLRHGCESLAALEEGFASGCVSLAVADECAHAAGPAGLFAARARSLLGSWGAGEGRPSVAVGGWPLATDVVAAAGALEIAVHGWDVAQASGSRLPIPPSLATGLLAIAPLIVTSADRAELFARAAARERRRQCKRQRAADRFPRPAGAWLACPAGIQCSVTGWQGMRTLSVPVPAACFAPGRRVMAAATSTAASTGTAPQTAMPARAPKWFVRAPMTGAPIGVPPMKASMYRPMTRPRSSGSTASCTAAFAMDWNARLSKSHGDQQRQEHGHVRCDCRGRLEESEPCRREHENSASRDVRLRRPVARPPQTRSQERC